MGIEMVIFHIVLLMNNFHAPGTGFCRDSSQTKLGNWYQFYQNAPRKYPYILGKTRIQAKIYRYSLPCLMTVILFFFWYKMGHFWMSLVCYLDGILCTKTPIIIRLHRMVLKIVYIFPPTRVRHPENTCACY